MLYLVGKLPSTVRKFSLQSVTLVLALSKRPILLL